MPNNNVGGAIHFLVIIAGPVALLSFNSMEKYVNDINLFKSTGVRLKTSPGASDPIH